MLNFINRGIEKIKSFFVFNKEQSEKCRKCSIVKHGGVSPAIVFTQRNINHEDCDSNCGVDNKLVFISVRLIIVVLVGYIIYRYGAIALDVISYYFK
jgi:hypothetical protein